MQMSASGIEKQTNGMFIAMAWQRSWFAYSRDPIVSAKELRRKGGAIAFSDTI